MLRLGEYLWGSAISPLAVDSSCPTTPDCSGCGGRSPRARKVACLRTTAARGLRSMIQSKTRPHCVPHDRNARLLRCWHFDLSLLRTSPHIPCHNRIADAVGQRQSRSLTILVEIDRLQHALSAARNDNAALRRTNEDLQAGILQRDHELAQLTDANSQLREIAGAKLSERTVQVRSRWLLLLFTCC